MKCACRSKPWAPRAGHLRGSLPPPHQRPGAAPIPPSAAVALQAAKPPRPPPARHLASSGLSFSFESLSRGKACVRALLHGLGGLGGQVLQEGWRGVLGQTQAGWGHLYAKVPNLKYILQGRSTQGAGEHGSQEFGPANVRGTQEAVPRALAPARCWGTSRTPEPSPAQVPGSLAEDAAKDGHASTDTA